MGEKFKRFTVDVPDSFYDSMTGKLIQEFDRTYLLEFFSEKSSFGLQRVMFFKDQVRYDGEY